MICAQHLLFDHLFWCRLVSFPLRARGVEFLVTLAQCTNLQQDGGQCWGSSIQAVVLEGEGMKRLHFLRVNSSHKRVCLDECVLRPVSAPASFSFCSVDKFLTHICRDFIPIKEGACATRPGPLALQTSERFPTGDFVYITPFSC